MDQATLINILTAVATIVTGIIGAGGLTSLVVKILEYRRSRESDATSVVNANLERMEARIKEIEISEALCRELKEDMALEIGQLRADNITLKAQILELHRLIDGYKLGITARIHCNSLGMVSYWSDSAQEIFGWSKEEVLDKSIEMLMPEHIKEKFRIGFLKAVGMPYIKTSNLYVANALVLTKGGISRPVSIGVNSFLIDGKIFFETEIRLKSS